MSKRNSNNKTVFIVLAILLLGMCLCGGAYQLFVNNCFWWNCAPTRNFSLADLDLPAYLFPADAEIENLRYLRNDLSVDPAVASIQWNNGTASYSIRKFSTTSQASREYEFQINSRIFTASTKPSDNVSDILNYKSNTADESIIRCGYVLRDFRCLFVARYQEFTVKFSSTIEASGMSNDKYLSVLKYIDNRMGELL